VRIDDLKRQAIEKCAATVLEEHGVAALPVQPIAIAGAQDIEVHAKPESAQGVSGMLVKSGDAFAIAYATHVKNEGFRRFSIAHELGHYFLPGHPEAVFAHGGIHASHAGFMSDRSIEIEADYFAACLLMPRKLFVRAMNRRRDGLSAVLGLADICGTSRTAAAIRYAELSGARTAVIVSASTTIDYCFLSPTLRSMKGIQWPKKGRPLPRGSATALLRSKQGAVENCESDSADSDTTEWFDADDETRLVEETIGLGEYGRTLTVLTVEDESERDDEGEASEPRFAR
jgi:hypothetical protein